MAWGYAYTPYVWPSFLTVILLLVLAGYGARRRGVPGALTFAIGCLFAALWAAGALMEYAAVDVATKIFWVKFQAVWQLPATTAITCFILEYTFPGRWLTRRNLAVLSVPPLAFAILALTNDLYHLAWRGFAFDGSVIGSVVPLRTPATWSFITYGYALALINVTVLAWLFVRSPEHRWPVAVILTGQIGARVVYALEAADLVRTRLPLDTVMMAYLFATYAIALFGFRILDPIRLARQTAIAQLRDGVVVLDPQGRVASLNPAAQGVLGVTEKGALGRPIQDLLSANADLPEEVNARDGTETEVSLGAGRETRYYAVNSSALRDWRGVDIGRLLLLHDVTAQKHAQAQIIAQQRALAMLQEREKLARELHDSLGQAFAFVNSQGQTVRRLLSRGDIPTADAYVGRLVDVAREADVDIRESILGLRASLAQQGLFAALAHYLAQYERNYGIRIDLQQPEPCWDGVFEPLVEVQLLRIVQEALTNVRKHAEARSVQVAFAFENGCARVTVRDDGRGFDPSVRPDGSGEHVGLRIMHERAKEVGGSFSVHSEPDQGTVVVVRVPVRGGRDGVTRGHGDGVRARHGERERG